MKVLVVDDDLEVRVLLSKVLTKAGYEVDTAATGEAALQALEGLACLVVDKVLPGLGGLELMTEARLRHPHLPVVLITGHPEPFQLGYARPDAVLLKPFANLGALIEAVDSVIEAREPQPVSLKERVAAVVANIAPALKKKGP